MLTVYLLGLAFVFTLIQLLWKWEWNWPRVVEVFLSYVLFFCVGVMGILGAYAHLFMGAEVAKLIGWAPGSPFQYEVGMANFSYGVLGLMSFWVRGSFWGAVIVGWSIFVLGCFVGHIMDYIFHDNTAPYNIGLQIWLWDFIVPLLLIGLYKFHLKHRSDPASTI